MSLNTPPPPLDEYRRRIARWDAEISAYDQTSDRISNLRLLTAALAIGLGILVVRGDVASSWMAAPMLTFLGLVIWHSRVIDRATRARRGRAWYERGVARITGTWSGEGPDGRKFLTGQAFAADLDLFGPGSLFQLLHTARTEAGEETLAAWLLTPADPEEIRARQAAVEELRPAIDFRESVAVTAVGARTSRTGGLAAWAVRPTAGFPAGIGWVFGLMGVISTGLVLAQFLSMVSGSVLLVSLVVQLGLVVLFWRHNEQAVADIERAAHDLELLAAVLARIEQQDMQCERLRRIRDGLVQHGAPPSRRIASLLRLITALDSTRNQIFAPLAWLLMLPYQLSAAIDRWHRDHAAAIPAWLTAVGDIEALSALATFAYEHPRDPFPTIVTGTAPVFAATALGHPLIHEDTAIRNDVAIGDTAPHLLLVSGSNMSGKSTLLRAIGVNTVLALCGAPVRAGSLRLSQLTLGSSLRIEDSLQAGHSRFYAEILRIRDIVALTRSSSAVLFLLDEMLAGTNSHDRAIGAEAIIRTLVAHGAIGLVTTHDLALADLVPSMGALAANVHFEDRIEDGTMVFDYQMRPGVVTHSNALALMRAIGLDV